MADTTEGSQRESKFSSFKKRKGNFGQRRKAKESSDSEDNDESAVVKVQRKGQKSKILGNSSGLGLSKLEKNTKRHKNDSESDEESIFKKKSKEKTSVTYDSSRTGKRVGPDDMGATAITEVDTEFDRDAQAIYEKQLKTNKDKKGEKDDNLYTGQSGYAKYYEKRDTAQGNAASGMVRYVPKCEGLYIGQASWQVQIWEVYLQS